MANISFIVKKFPVPEPSWIETKGPTYWTDNADIDWNVGNNRYETQIAEGTQVQLDATSEFDDWRGTQMNFTFINSSNTITIIVIDTDDTTIGQVSDIALSGETTVEIPLSFGSFDIDRVVFITSGVDWISFDLTSINAYQGPPNWQSHYDDSDFDAYYGAWNVDKWDSQYDGVYDEELVILDVLGTWYEDYRPTKMKITYTGGDTLVISAQDSSAPIMTPGPYASGAEIDLTWDGDDLAFISIVSTLPSSFSVTNIEWLGLAEVD